MPLSGVDVAIGRNTFDPPAPVVPLTSIHQRQAVLHDSGTPEHSGVVSFNSGENRLELIPSNSGAQPIVTAVLIDAYDETGGTTVSTSLVTVIMDVERVNTHPNVFVLSSNQIQVNMPGVYEIEYRVSIDAVDASTRSSCRVGLYRTAPGGSATEVTGARSYTYNRLSAAGEDSVACRVILDDVVVGDIFEVQAIRIAGADCTTIADGSSLTIKKLA